MNTFLTRRFSPATLAVLMIATLAAATLSSVPAAHAACAYTVQVEYRPALYECETNAPGWFVLVRNNEDKIWMRSVANLPSNQVRIYLTSSSYITWWKGLELKDQSNNIRGSVQTQDSNRGPNSTLVYTNSMNLTQSSLHFLKAKFLGIHTDMYYMANLSAYAGRTIYIYWSRDDACPGVVSTGYDC